MFVNPFIEAPLSTNHNMREIDSDKALRFILKAMWSKQGGDDPFSKWLEKNDLFVHEVKDIEVKTPAFEGSVVMLKASEKERLEAHYTKDELRGCYEKLDAYIRNKKGKPYKDHYAALNAWVIEQVVGFKRREPINIEVRHWNEGV
jgi:hypothetical protein